MDRAWGIKDRGQQRDFLRACVEEIRVTPEEVNIRFSLNVAAAMAAIGPEADPDPDSGTNCQLRLGGIGSRFFRCGHRSPYKFAVVGQVRTGTRPEGNLSTGTRRVRGRFGRLCCKQRK
jgi:hypothetical protein